jgi:hypothetical protein
MEVIAGARGFSAVFAQLADVLDELEGTGSD